MALIFGSPDSEPTEIRPADFPYWENISQHRHDGPSVIYLGAGWILTARHVGFGEVALDGVDYVPDYQSRHPLLNPSGTPADVIVFKLNDDQEYPDLPILPLANVPPEPGEEVLVIGFGRERQKAVEWHEDGQRQFRFEWSADGSKRWGTNRVVASGGVLPQKDWLTHVFSFSFDEPGSEDVTRFEAQAAVGDSGGAVFVQREEQWQLAGVMVSVSGGSESAMPASHYGDMTYAADVSFYRSEFLRWARPRCFNEEDDDGDGHFDFPADPGCESRLDSDERDTTSGRDVLGLSWAISALGLGMLGIAAVLHRRGRESD